MFKFNPNLMVVVFGIFLIISPMVVFGLNVSSVHLTMARLDNNNYVAFASNCVPDRTYELQFIYEGVVMDWVYGGYFVANQYGRITTFELTLPLPDSPYPYNFRMRDVETGDVSNLVIIDALNPPPVGKVLGEFFLSLEVSPSIVENGEYVSLKTILRVDAEVVIGEEIDIFYKDTDSNTYKFLCSVQSVGAEDVSLYKRLVEVNWFPDTSVSLKAVHSDVESNIQVLYKDGFAPIQTVGLSLQIVGAILACVGTFRFVKERKKK